MIIRIESETFQAIAHAIPKVTASPIAVLSGVRVEAKGGRLGVYATDLETWVIATAACGGDDGEVLVPRRMIEALHGATDEIEIEKIDKRVALRAGGVEIECEAADADEYPSAPKIPNVMAKGTEVDTAVLRWVRLAACTDETRYNLNGVFFGAQGEIVATDGHRMHIVEAAASVTPAETKAAWGADGVIVPSGSVDAMIAACGDRVIVRATDGLIIAAALRDTDPEIADAGGIGVMIVARAIDGQFPNWRQVVPDHGDTDAKRLRVGAEALVGAVRVLSATVRDRHAHVLIDAADGQCVLRLGDRVDGIGGKARVVPCEGEGSTCVNAGYLLDALAGVEGEVGVQVSDGARSTAWRPVGDARRTAIVMPVRR